jgi:hypothetical protein
MVGANIYPLIVEFIGKLAKIHPKHLLATHIDTFDALDFHHIDELASLSPRNI